MVRGLQDFKASRKEELSFCRLERLTIINYTENPEWVLARNTSSQEGLIPVENVCFLKEVKQNTNMG